MAPVQPTPIPYVPAPQPPIKRDSGLFEESWIQFFLKMVQFVSTLTERGLRADQPAATSVYPGTLYYVSDEARTEKSNGFAWEDYTDGGDIVAADPLVPIDNTWWIFRDGGSPQNIEMHLRIGGVTYAVPLFTVP